MDEDKRTPCKKAAAAALAEYTRTIAAAEAKYERLLATARVEIDHATAPTWVEYWRVIDAALAKLDPDKTS